MKHLSKEVQAMLKEKGSILSDEQADSLTNKFEYIADLLIKSVTNKLSKGVRFTLEFGIVLLLGKIRVEEAITYVELKGISLPDEFQVVLNNESISPFTKSPELRDKILEVCNGVTIPKKGKFYALEIQESIGVHSHLSAKERKKGGAQFKEIELAKISISELNYQSYNSQAQCKITASFIAE